MPALSASFLRKCMITSYVGFAGNFLVMSSAFISCMFHVCLHFFTVARFTWPLLRHTFDDARGCHCCSTMGALGSCTRHSTHVASRQGRGTRVLHCTGRSFWGPNGVEKHKRQVGLASTCRFLGSKSTLWHRESVYGLIIVGHSLMLRTCWRGGFLGLMLVLKRYERNACFEYGIGIMIPLLLDRASLRRLGYP
jgi:hypothetical protein